MPASSHPSEGQAANEALVAELLGLMERAAATEVGSVWKEFEAAIATHFDSEERTILADLLVARPREARVILEEHRYLRGRLAQLREAVPRGLARGALHTFISELRAHGRQEERVFRHWRESSCPTQPTVLQAKKAE